MTQKKIDGIKAYLIWRMSRDDSNHYCILHISYYRNIAIYCAFNMYIACAIRMTVCCLRIVPISKLRIHNMHIAAILTKAKPYDMIWYGLWSVTPTLQLHLQEPALHCSHFKVFFNFFCQIFESWWSQWNHHCLLAPPNPEFHHDTFRNNKITHGKIELRLVLPTQLFIVRPDG